MFGKIASDVLGISDIGKIILPKDYDKVESDNYIRHEDNEKIYFLIKSKSDEYCFTDLALIHVDGASAVSKKRSLWRYDYYLHNLSDVRLETAGTVDLDVEIKFLLGNKQFSIDVDKNQLEQLKDLYKALLKIAEIKHDKAKLAEYANQSIKYASQTLGSARTETRDLFDSFKQINEYSYAWLVNNHHKHLVKNFGAVFERYIKN